MIKKKIDEKKVEHFVLLIKSISSDMTEQVRKIGKLHKENEFNELIGNKHSNFLYVFFFNLNNELSGKDTFLPILNFILKEYPLCRVYQLIYGDSDDNIWMRLNVETYPLCVFYKSGKEVGRYKPTQKKDVFELCEKFSCPMVEELVIPEPKNISECIVSDDVVLIITGSEEEVDTKEFESIIKENISKYTKFHIGQNKELIREFIDFSGCKEFPQIYLHQKFFGCLDTLKSFQEHQLKLVFSDSVFERIYMLIKENPVMIFMKGTPDKPFCKFSKSLMSIMEQINIKYGYFDIFEDEDIREKLKTFSDWPTYPQLYYHQKLVGGYDVIKELFEEGTLIDELSK